MRAKQSEGGEQRWWCIVGASRGRSGAVRWWRWAGEECMAQARGGGDAADGWMDVEGRDYERVKARPGTTAQGRSAGDSKLRRIRLTHLTTAMHLR